MSNRQQFFYVYITAKPMIIHVFPAFSAVLVFIDDLLYIHLQSLSCCTV